MLDKRLINQARKEKKNFYIVLGSGFFTGILAVLQAACLAAVFNGVFKDNQGLKQISPWLFAFLTVICLRAFLAWISETAARRAGAQVKHRLRQELLARLFELGPVSAGNTGMGEKITLLVDGIENLEAYFTKYLPQLVLALFIPVALLLVALPTDWITGLILLFTAPLLPIFMILIGSWSEKMANRQWQTLKRLSNHLFDVLQGLTTLKLLGRSKKQIEIIARLSRQWTDSTLSVLRIAFLSALTLELIVTLSTAMIAVGLGLRLLTGGISFERAMFLLLLAPEFYGPLRLLGAQFHAGQQGAAAAEDLFALLNTTDFNGVTNTQNNIYTNTHTNTDTKINTNTDINTDTTDTYIAPETAPAVILSKVCYTYDDRLPALNGLSFSITQGEKVALIGKSGAGKSTVIHLLMRFITPDQGTIAINGQSSSAVSPEDWRQNITLIPQHPHLFAGTVKENIALGNPEASQADIEEAAGLAYAHDFIAALPAGYDTFIGQHGQGLSTGQGQRIAIARAFLRQTPLLILDEATAGLDYESENLIRLSLARLLQNRTALIIAHRPATLKLADRILVLDQGRIHSEGGEQR